MSKIHLEPRGYLGKKKIFKLERLFPILLLGIPSQIDAQSIPKKDTLYRLNEAVVVYQAGKKTPVTFQDVSTSDLQVKTRGQEPSFILSEYPSITNTSDAGSFQGYSYFRLRGIDQTRVNITLDGVPLNEPEDQGAYFSNYPDLLNSTSKVQIQRGVGTSKNGVANYAGSVQLFSPNLFDSARTSVGLGYGSFNSLRTFGEIKSGVKRHKAIYARVSEVYSDGYKYHSGNNSQSALISGGFFRDKSTWRMKLVAGHQQNQLAWLGVKDSLIKLDRRTNANSNENDNFVQSLVQLENHSRLTNNTALHTSIYYTYLKGNYDFNLNNFIGLPTPGEFYNYAFKSQLLGFYSNYTLSKNGVVFTAGMNGNTYKREHIGTEKALGLLYENTGYKDEVSVFSKAEYSHRWLTLFSDLQFRFTTFNYKGSVFLEKYNWQFFNPKVGITGEINPHSVIYYCIGGTGREPTRNDLFGGNDNLLADSLGRAILSIKTPEYVTDHELGVRQWAKRWSVNANLYFMNFRNEIVLDGKLGPNGLALTDKVDQSIRTGAEINFVHRITNHFTMVNNSSYNYSRIIEQRAAFTPILTPPVIINEEAVYSFKNISVAVGGRYQHKSFIDFANSAQLQSYFILNARAGYDVGRFQWSVFLGNITNSKYCNSGYVDFDGSKKYFAQAPVNFYSSIRYRF
jgi:iron complex outermembrane recepter protein